MDSWIRARTPDGRWFEIEWDKRPTLDDLTHMMKVLAVVVDGYRPLKQAPKKIGGVPVVSVWDVWQWIPTGSSVTP